MILGIGALVMGYYGMNIPNLGSVLTNPLFGKISFVATLVMTLHRSRSLSILLFRIGETTASVFCRIIFEDRSRKGVFAVLSNKLVTTVQQVRRWLAWKPAMF